MVWEDNVSVLEEMKSYKFDIITIRSFNDATYLSVSKESMIETSGRYSVSVLLPLIVRFNPPHHLRLILYTAYHALRRRCIICSQPSCSKLSLALISVVLVRSLHFSYGLVTVWKVHLHNCCSELNYFLAY